MKLSQRTTWPLALFIVVAVAGTHAVDTAMGPADRDVAARRHYNATRHDHPHPVPPRPGDDTLGLRIAGILLILAITALGLGVFFLPAAKAITTPTLLILRSFSAGSMVSVAIVHILAEAGHANFGTLFPVPETLLTLGMLLSWAFSVLPDHDHAHAHGTPPSDVEGTLGTQMQPMKGNDATTDEEAGGRPGPAGPTVHTSRLAVESLEIGCVSHSLILGITLGLQTSVTSATVLLIVFSLHNGLEALCLGHLFAGLQNRTEQVLMVVFTSVSLPIGGMVGIIIERTSEKGDLFTWTSAISCVAGGMLLYGALVDIVGEDVRMPIVKADKGLRFKMFVALLFGLGAMTALAAGEMANGEHAH